MVETLSFLIQALTGTWMALIFKACRCESNSNDSDQINSISQIASPIILVTSGSPDNTYRPLTNFGVFVTIHRASDPIGPKYP